MSELAVRDRAWWARLGFRDEDLVDVMRLVADVAARDDSDGVVDRIAQLAHTLTDRVGQFAQPGQETEAGEEAEATLFSAADAVLRVGEVEVMGAVPLLALAASTDAVRAFHHERGISQDLSWRALSDLGQQVWVHRRTYGSFGLHTHDWLETAWSGALLWLGRLQFNVERRPAAGLTPAWVISTHIPATGPLDPGEVEVAFSWAERMFSTVFADLGPSQFYCSSWLLDPRLSELGPSNLAQFQARWTLIGAGTEGQAGAWFFVFQRRGEVDPDTLPADSSLRRLILSEYAAGRPWRTYAGVRAFSGQSA